MKFSLDNRTALVTGGGSGIGRAISRAFAASGAAVIVLDLDSDAGTSVAQDITGNGGVACAVQADVGQMAQVRAAVELGAKKMNAPDILVNNAGFTRDRSLTKMTDQEWSGVLSVVLDGAFNCTKAVLPAMRSKGWGRLINISSRAYLGKIGRAHV